MARKRELSDEERILWNLVARTTTPLRGKSVAEPEALPKEPAPPAARSAEPTPLPAKAAPALAAKLQVQHLDRTTQKKIARGKLPLEARIDLHGLRQDAAHSLLQSFLRRAHDGGVRYVLVITGKGSSSASDGVLKRSVPGWFTTPAFRDLVSGYEDASRSHGGEGALYVRLRRMVKP